MVPSNLYRACSHQCFPDVRHGAAPVADDDQIAAKSDTQLTLDYLLFNDKDADGNTLNITAITAPAHGVLTSLGLF